MGGSSLRGLAHRFKRPGALRGVDVPERGTDDVEEKKKWGRVREHDGPEF